MGKNYCGAENAKNAEVVELNQKGFSFIVKFLNPEFEGMFREESDFYKNELMISTISEDNSYYVVTENPEGKRIDTAKAWFILHEKYRALSGWGKNAPVQFLGAFGSNGFSGITMLPTAFLQA